MEGLLFTLEIGLPQIIFKSTQICELDQFFFIKLVRLISEVDALLHPKDRLSVFALNPGEGRS